MRTIETNIEQVNTTMATNFAQFIDDRHYLRRRYFERDGLYGILNYDLQ